MPGDELPRQSSRMRTDTVGPTNVLSVDGVTTDSPQPHHHTKRSCGSKDAMPSPDDSPDSAPPAQRHPSLPSAVIHELRTPLTSIHGYAQVLQRSLRNEPRSANALAVVVRESTRLSGMLSELSELAELDAGHERPPLMRVDTDQIVDGVVDEVMRRDSQAHPIQMTGRGTACSNPTRLSQALMHVLTNAVKYSDASKPVDVSISESGSAVIIEVADRGIGIMTEDAERVYEPFQRGTLARQAGIRGLGLGLFLARETLAQDGGNLNHSARTGGGTVFRLTLPRA